MKDPRPKLFVLCPHEPVTDPRIDWTCTMAADEFDVTLFGIRHHEGDLYSGRKYKVRTARAHLAIRPLFELFGHVAVTHGVFAFIFFVFSASLIVAALPLLAIFYLFSKLPGFRRLKPLRSLRQFGFLAAHFVRSYTTLYEMATSVGPPRVIHANDLDTLLTGAVLKRKFGARLVYDNHEYYPAQFSSWSWLLVRSLTALERFLVNEADSVVIVTPQLADVMKKKYTNLNRVYVVPNCAPLAQSAVSNEARDPGISFLYLGAFLEGRGIDQLIRHWARLSPADAKLTLQGPHNLLKQSFEKLAADLGVLNKSVFFPAPVVEADLITEAAKHDVGIIPYEAITINNKFSCPNKLSQFLQAGLAVLTNDLEFVRQQVEQFRCGWVFDINNYSSFEKTVREIQSNPGQLKEFKSNARSAALEFNWENLGQVFIQLYRGADLG